MALYASRKKEWLALVLDLANGVPSYTTFWTVFALLNPVALEKSFVHWVRSRVNLKVDDVVSIDGKALRGRVKQGQPHSFVHIVSACAAANHLTLGQLKVDGKSNEITAIPQLLEVLDIEGTIVTIDAMGCQTGIAEKIVEKKANYVLALKGNQGMMADEVGNYFTQAEAANFEGISSDAVGSKDAGHGRVEEREVYVVDELDWLPQKDEWKNLKSIVMVVSKRLLPDQPPSIEKRYYLSSLLACALNIAHAIRSHWGIENQAHWVLDVALREDEQKANGGNIAENISLMRRMALNLLKSALPIVLDAIVNAIFIEENGVWRDFVDGHAIKHVSCTKDAAIDHHARRDASLLRGSCDLVAVRQIDNGLFRFDRNHKILHRAYGGILFHLRDDFTELRH